MLTPDDVQESINPILGEETEYRRGRTETLQDGKEAALFKHVTFHIWNPVVGASGTDWEFMTLDQYFSVTASYIIWLKNASFRKSLKHLLPTIISAHIW